MPDQVVDVVAPPVSEPVVAAQAPAVNIADTAAQVTAGQTPSAPVVEKTWLEGLPDDLKKDPALQNFKDPVSLAKSWVNAQKMIGADKVIIPGEKASEEELNTFFAKIGRPESADKYKLEGPDGYKIDENLGKGLVDTAFKAGLTQKQVSQLLNWYAGEEKSAMSAVEANQQKEMEDSINAYKEKLGGEDKFKTTVESARVALRVVGDADLNKFLVDTGLGSRPEMINFFAKLNGMMSEDKIRDGTGMPMGNNDPAEIQREITAIESMKDYWSGTLPNMADVTARRESLYKRLHASRNPAQ